jgi:serine/threonine protein kinase
MEDRYEIRGKIGQGGLGAVYRGYDTRMNREVAIKRITSSTGDPELQEESTRQLIKEAGALASLQHPHIVTIYDVGSDEDGPYVVMELISGKTLDELVENAPLTWPDFRELAMQTQEALIAAQELDLIHSDIKPSNLMLTWLPSGKFQIKIVDFGLATLTQSQSREHLQEMEAVFGSIFFMAPEQFERVPLDARSDLYSMGCVYYQALAGVHPFDGATAAEVMEAHLHHAVKPLQELRSDIPLWACDWIMWQINRMPQDRPESARESLSVFLQNDKNPNPTMSMGSVQAADAPKRPRLIIPGAEPVPVTTVSPAETAMPIDAYAPQAAAPNLAKQATQTQSVAPADPESAAAAPMMVQRKTSLHVELPPETVAMAPVIAADAPEPVKHITAPQPLMPPEGSKPSVHTASYDLPPPEPDPVPVVAKTVHVRVPAPSMPLKSAGPRKLSNNAKTVIAAILGILVVLFAWFLLNRSGKNREARLYNEMILEAAKSDTTEIPVNAEKLELLLNAATNTGVVEARQTVYQALFLAKAVDATDVDARIAEFATTREMLPDVREVLIRDVLRKRKNPSVVPTLLAYASRNTDDPRSAVAALQAVRFMAGDEQFDAFLRVIEGTNHDDVRKAAEETMVQILKKSPNRSAKADLLASTYENSMNDNVRHSMLRLLGRCGGPKALELVKQTLAGGEPKDQVAAIISISAWVDDSAFGLLLDFIASQSDEQLRTRAFDSALRFLTDGDVTRDADATRDLWLKLEGEAKTSAEQMKIIRGIVTFTDEWAMKLLEKYAEEDDDRVADLAEKAMERVRDLRRIRGNNN